MEAARGTRGSRPPTARRHVVTFSSKPKLQSPTKEKSYPAMSTSSRPHAVSRRPNPNPFSDSPGLLPSPRLRLSGRPVLANSLSLRSPGTGTALCLGGYRRAAGAGADRWEAHTAHAAGRGGSRLEGEPRAPSVRRPRAHEQQASPQQQAGQQVIFFSPS
jgi:hypothetical protein